LNKAHETRDSLSSFGLRIVLV